MAKDVATEKALVDRALQQHGVDLRVQVYFSTDAQMQGVLAALDRSDEDPIPGFRKRVMPLVTMNRGAYSVQTTLDPYSKVDWHCHKKHLVLHEVTSGHVIVERRQFIGGRPVEEDGKFVRERTRLEPPDFWIAPPGEPYAYETEEEAATTTYRHTDDPAFPPVNGCADPTATAEDP